MENRRPITYSFEDIKRYKQGLMNREEMHAFEKASMEDPFLADALEGYMQSDIVLADEHLANIAEKISGNEATKEKAVIVSMPQRRFGFMRVAAMVIVIAGAGLLTYKVFDKKDAASPDGQLATTTEQPAENKAGANVDSSLLPKTDTDQSTAGSFELGDNNKPVEKPLAAAPSKIERPNSVVPLGNNAIEPSGLSATEKSAAPVATKDEKTLKEEVVVQRNAEKDNTAYHYNAKAKAIVIANNEFKGRVLSPNNQPLANAHIQLDNSRKKIITDEGGNFQLNSKDTVVLATVESSGYMNTRVQLRSNSENTINIGNIVLQSDPAVENTIAVTGLGVTKKEKIADTLSTKPEGGWESFQQYVASRLNIKLDTTGRDMRLTGGELEIEFFVDANGVPKNFKVLNSTNPSINQQAIEAVQQGPKWATRKKKTRILIRY